MVSSRRTVEPTATSTGDRLPSRSMVGRGGGSTGTSAHHEDVPPHDGRVGDRDEERVEQVPPLIHVVGAVAHVPHPEELQGRMFERFLGTGPPKFTGSGDPVEAGNWLMEMEKILKRIGCPRELWVSNASFQLRDDAEF
ncbi:hypothetical protein Dimus_039058 [Dionaea muscipula]